MNIIDLSFTPYIDWNDLATRWVITLGHFLWQGTLIGLLLAATLFMKRHARSSTRYGLNVIGLVSLVPCLIITFAMVDMNQLRPDEFSSGYALESTIDPNRSTTPLSQPVIRPRKGADSVPGQHVVNEMHSPVTVASQTGPVASVGNDSSLTFSRLAPWVALMYMVGVSGLVLRTCCGMWRGHLLRAHLEHIKDPSLLCILETQATRLGLKTTPLIAFCERVSVPTVIGIVKPMVLLPVALATGLSANELAPVLRHELAHIQRYDLAVNLIQRLVESLLFFHPVVWWISKRVSAERENCCDDLAISEGSRIQYAGALLRMAELCALSKEIPFDSHPAVLSAFGDSTSQLSQRIRRLLGVPAVPKIGFSRATSISIGFMLPMIFALLIASAHIRLGPTKHSELDKSPEGSSVMNTSTGEPAPTRTPSTELSSTEPSLTKPSSTGLSTQEPVLLHGFDIARFRSPKSWGELQKEAIFDRDRSTTDGGMWSCWVDSAKKYSQWRVYYSPRQKQFWVRDQELVYGPIPGDAIEKLKLLDGSSDLVAAKSDRQNRARALSLHLGRIQSLLKNGEASLQAHGLRAFPMIGELKIHELDQWSLPLNNIARSDSNQPDVKTLLIPALNHLSSQRERIESLKVSFDDSEYERGRTPTRTELEAQWGPHNKGLSLAVVGWQDETRKVNFKDTITVKLLVRNVSDTPRRISTLNVLDGVSATVTDEQADQAALLTFVGYGGWPKVERHLLKPGEVVVAKHFNFKITEGDLHPKDKIYNPRNLEFMYGHIKMRTNRTFRIEFKLVMPSASSGETGGITLPAKGEFDGQLLAIPLGLAIDNAVRSKVTVLSENQNPKN